MIRPALRHFAAWIGLFIINILGIVPWAQMKFPLVDLAEIVYQTRRLQLGYVPYRDTFTHHFLGFALPLFAVGTIVPLSPVTLKLITLCFNFATAVVVWLILREVSRPQIAWLGAFLAVTLGWFWTWQGFGFNVQSCLTPMIATVILCVVRACLRSRPASIYVASLWSGVLMISDQRALAFLPLLVLPFVFVRTFRRWRVVSLSTLALALAPAVAAGYLWRHGAWADFVEQTLIFPFTYRNHGVPFALGPVLSSAFGSWLGGERIAMPLMLAGLAAALVLESRRAIQAAWLTAALGAAVYAMLGGRDYANYFMVFAPIALVMVSLLPHYLAGRWPAAGRASIILLLAFGAFCGLRPLALLSGSGSAFLPANETTVESAADYLRRQTSPQDEVLVWGYAPEIYVLSDRFRTFRDMGLLSITGGNFAISATDEPRLLPHMVREFNEYLRNSPPKVIAVYKVTREPCPGKGLILRNLENQHVPALKTLRDVLTSSYRSDLVVEGTCDRAELFLLRNPPTRTSRETVRPAGTTGTSLRGGVGRPD